MNKVISTTIGLIIIIAFAILATGGILAWQNGWLETNKAKTDQGAQTQNLQNETANWETYTNEIHKFEIKYPKEWTLQKEVGVPPATIIGRRWDDKGYCSMNLLIVENGTPSTAEMDWYRQNGYKEESINIAGMMGTKFSKFPVENNGPVAVVYFKNNSDRIDMIASADKYQECSGVFNLMLSTFKFTNSQNQTACTQEAKQCPDGSYVSRTGPNCEFTQCPTVSNLTNWVGTYEYGESAPPDEVWIYILEIYKDGKANLNIDGFQTMTRILATAKENNGKLDIIFSGYAPDNIYGNFQKGDLLLSLQKTSSENYKIIWNKMTPNLPSSTSAEFQKNKD